MLNERQRRLDSASRHILLIEDNADGRESLRILLSYLGHRVDVATNGLEGLQKALNNPPEIAIVDIGLPLLDGYQVAKQIRAALGREIILIAYTAYDGPETERRARQAGFDVHLVKPIELSELEPWLRDEQPASLSLC
jgi:two-component system, sensor histidine kinase